MEHTRELEAAIEQQFENHHGLLLSREFEETGARRRIGAALRARLDAVLGLDPGELLRAQDREAVEAAAKRLEQRLRWAMEVSARASSALDGIRWEEDDRNGQFGGARRWIAKKYHGSGYVDWAEALATDVATSAPPDFSGDAEAVERRTRDYAAETAELGKAVGERGDQHTNRMRLASVYFTAAEVAATAATVAGGVAVAARGIMAGVRAVRAGQAVGSRVLRRVLTPVDLLKAAESGVLKGNRGLYAFEGKEAVGVVRRFFGGVGSSATEHVIISGSAAQAFRAPLPTGLLNMFRRFAGVRFAPGSVLREAGAWSRFAPDAAAHLTDELYFAVADVVINVESGTLAYVVGKVLYAEGQIPR